MFHDAGVYMMLCLQHKNISIEETVFTSNKSFQLLIIRLLNTVPPPVRVGGFLQHISHFLYRFIF